MKTYRYPLPPKEPDVLPARRLQPEAESDPALTGFVQGKEASNLEEMWARSLDKTEAVESYSFRVVFAGQSRNDPGAAEVDYLVRSGGLFPVQLDAEFTHKDAETRAHDDWQDQRVDEMLRSQGARPVKRIKLSGKESQDDIDQIAEAMFS